MKRRQPKEVNKQSKKTLASLAVWTKKEDEHLLKVVAETKHMNWRMICKAQNRKFENKVRTPEECEQRYSTLKCVECKNEREVWSTSENCALLCSCLLHDGNWDLIITSMPSRTKKATQKHLVENIQEVAKLVQDKLYKNVDCKNSTEILKTFTCVKLIIDSLENSALYSKITKLLTKFKLITAECLEFLGFVGKEANMDTSWTSEKLSKYLLNAVETIQNRHILKTLKEDPDRTLDGLIHERVEDRVGLTIPNITYHIRHIDYHTL